MNRWIVFLTALWIWIFPLVPATAEPEGADALIMHGIELRRQGRDEEALTAFQQALALERNPVAQAQIGLAQQALGHWLAAEASLQAALAQDRHPWIAENRQQLQTALAEVQRHIGELEVRCPVPRAEVWLSGKRVAELPMPTPLRLVIGPALVEVRAPGHYAVARSVLVQAGTLARETFELSPLPAAPRANRTLRILGITAGSLAVVALILGGVAQSQREVHVAAWNNDDVCLRNFQSRLDNCAAEQNAAHLSQALAITGFVAGGALAATAATLLFYSRPRQREIPRFLPAAGPGTAGLSLSWRF